MSANLLATLVTKLTVSNHLDSDDIRAVQSLSIRERHVDAREMIVAEGDHPHESCLISTGFAERSKSTADGGRQVLSLHIAGEIPDLQSLHLNIMDHDLITLTPCTLGYISHDELNRVNQQRPNLAAALWRETLIDASIFREWIVNVGRREATPRMAHLFVEMYTRLKSIGHTREGRFDFPVTQNDLADCLGLSVVHVNRVLQSLRKDGLITANRSEFKILEPKRLADLAGFDATYLHLGPHF